MVGTLRTEFCGLFLESQTFNCPERRSPIDTRVKKVEKIQTSYFWYCWHFTTGPRFSLSNAIRVSYPLTLIIIWSTKGNVLHFKFLHFVIYSEMLERRGEKSQRSSYHVHLIMSNMTSEPEAEGQSTVFSAESSTQWFIIYARKNKWPLVTVLVLLMIIQKR